MKTNRLPVGPFFALVVVFCGDLGCENDNGPSRDATGADAGTSDMPDAGADATNTVDTPVDLSTDEEEADRSPSGNNDSGPSPEAQAACESYATGVCSKLSRRDPESVKLYIDEATCRERLTLSCLANAFGPGTMTDPQARSMCGDMIAAAGCNSSVPDACRWNAGTLADGDGCLSNPQCQSGYCQYWGLCGVCTARSDAGQPCAYDDACPTGMFCSPSSSGGSCRTYSTLGQSCDGRYQQCEDGLSCYAGGCIPGRKEGDACQQSVECFNGIYSLYCGPSHTCERPAVSDPGGPCGYRDGKEVGCTGSAECKGLVNTGDQGICAAPAYDGDECEYGCLPPARCVDRKCRVIGGADCSLKVPAGGGNQYLILRWEGVATVSCDAAQATTVLADVGGRPFSFPCSLGRAKTSVLPPGFYDVTLSLVDAMSSVLRTAKARVLLTANLPFEIFMPFEP